MDRAERIQAVGKELREALLAELKNVQITWPPVGQVELGKNLTDKEIVEKAHWLARQLPQNALPIKLAPVPWAAECCFIGPVRAIRALDVSSGDMLWRLDCLYTPPSNGQ